MAPTRESGTIKKRWRGRLPVALVFPNTYRVGMANLGFLSIYEFLNREEEIVCERFFWSEGLPLRSVESGRPLRDFRVVLFSIPFEGDYPRVLRILTAGDLPLEPSHRKIPVLAGGVAIWLNPRPLFPFLDGFLLGELEVLGKPLVEALLSGDTEREKLLARLSRVPGFLNPEGPFPVSIAKVPELTRPLLSHLRSPEAEFGETQLLEITRGCGESCRFCAAGFIYRPPRRPSRKALFEVLEELSPGVKVGLIGLEFLKTEAIVEFTSELLSRGHRISFSSVRLDALSPELKPIFREVRTLTLAPEAGSESLRRILNKHLSDETLLRTAALLRDWPNRRLKLYFMFGLPGETEEDLAAIVRMVSRIKELSRKEITVSLSPFVPKPWTPFQWAPFETPSTLKKKARHLRRALSARGVRVSIESIREAQIQALVSRGSEVLAPFLREMARGESLSRALRTLPSSPENLFRGPREPFPWEEVVHAGIDREFLRREWERALAGEESPRCPARKNCRACGACLALYGAS
ncbi:radical SAM protein [Thermosulfurimonas sp. F29]|uniref:radical SAM protein n=1 Tax=Thermosulfurimonas sp. F29 TaxID=2867247 RepID=UPI001C83579B|nr:radical SAM protein [Thermosulfurimonas sp. F29]MBX6422894.1 radical SAM protein [Thermosulfurimonas sp. F29]